MEDIEAQETTGRLTNGRDRCRAVFQSMAEPAFVVAHSSLPVMVNKAFERFFGVGEAG